MIVGDEAVPFYDLVNGDIMYRAFNHVEYLPFPTLECVASVIRSSASALLDLLEAPLQVGGVVPAS